MTNPVETGINRTVSTNEELHNSINRSSSSSVTNQSSSEEASIFLNPRTGELSSDSEFEEETSTTDFLRVSPLSSLRQISANTETGVSGDNTLLSNNSYGTLARPFLSSSVSSSSLNPFAR